MCVKWKPEIGKNAYWITFPVKVLAIKGKYAWIQRLSTDKPEPQTIYTNELSREQQ